MTRPFLCVLPALLLWACGASPSQPEPIIPEDSLTQTPEQAELPALSDAVKDTIEDLREIAQAGRLSTLANRAEREEGFVSNFGADSHFTHWDLLRRTGVDPNAKLLELFDEPYAQAQAAGETWYIWPDLAVREAGELIPEKLSFVDRARLRRLIGDEGIEAIRQGHDYPGFRTAIDEAGRWLYFTHHPQPDAEEDP